MNSNSVCTFNSKRNTVNLISFAENNSDIQKNYVVKSFVKNISGFNTEIEVINLLKHNGIPVPKIIDVKDYNIIYEYLEGPIVMDFLDIYEKNHNSKEVFEVFDRLCLWLKNAYSVMKNFYGKTMVLGDSHLRNFIYSNNTLYGIDFECVCPGIIERDIAYLAVITVTYSPMCTKEKYEIASFICKRCIQLMDLDYNLLKNELETQLKTISNRRKTKLPDEIIPTLCSLIKQ